MNKEDLQNQKNLYERLKEVLENVLNAFSSTNFNDDILYAKRALSSYLLINDEDVCSSKLSFIEENVSTDIEKIKSILVIIEEKIAKLNDKLVEASINMMG